MQVFEFSSFSTGKAYIIIDKNKITIRRTGFIAALRYGLKGEKTFFIHQISGVQFKEAGFFIGYIQFVLNGSHESKGGLNSATRDENSVCFSYGLFNKKEINETAYSIKKYVEKYIESTQKPQSKEIIKEDDKFDKLKKLKNLLDDDVITKEEFEKEKAKILG